MTELQTDDPDHVQSLREFLAAVARQASANVPEHDDADGGEGADENSPAERSTRAFRALAEDPEH